MPVQYAHRDVVWTSKTFSESVKKNAYAVAVHAASPRSHELMHGGSATDKEIGGKLQSNSS